MKFVPALLLLVLTSSCAPRAPIAPAIVLGDAWARATAPGQTSAALYATITNHGGADRLVGVSSAAGMAMLHASASDDGVARMRMLSEVPIPAGATVALSPGGTHVMVTGLAGPLAVGTQVPLTLRFASAGARTVTVTVVAAGSR